MCGYFIVHDSLIAILFLITVIPIIIIINITKLVSSYIIMTFVTIFVLSF